MSKTTAIALLLATLAACDREAGTSAAAGPSAAPPPAAPASAERADDQATRPAEIYFDLTAFEWYRQGRPLLHNGRSYMPQSDPAPVEVELEEAGTFEGVTYYRDRDAREPVYTLYVPVYYRYWQRFTAPPGA